MADPPAWLPDWTKKEQYREKLPRRLWAWEFLRRNAEYQADARIACEIMRRENCIAHQEGCPPPWPADRKLIPPPLDDDAWRNHTERLNDGLVTAVYDMLLHQIARKWGMLLPLPEPSQSTPKGLLFMVEALRCIGGTGASAQVVKQVIKVEPGKHWFEIDENLPIQPQLDRIKQSVQGRKVKTHVDKFPEYLRLLDAEAVGVVEPREIGAVIYKGKGAEPAYRLAYDGLEAARRYRDGDYLLIAASKKHTEK